MQFAAAEKFRQIKRAYARFKKINTDNGNTIDNRDARDAAEEFFSQCYHFKDWLKKDCAIRLGSDIEDFISQSKPLSLAADFCNSFKHGGLDRKPRSGNEIDQVLTHMKLEITPRGFVASSRIELVIGNTKYDGLKLADDCLREWDRFLAGNGIAFPPP